MGIIIFEYHLCFSEKNKKTKILCNLSTKISLKVRNSFEMFKTGYGIVSEILRNIYPCSLVVECQALDPVVWVQAQVRSV